MMKSKIIGAVEFDEGLLQKEIETIEGFGPLKEIYSEFGFGTWNAYVLWNESGDHDDSLFTCRPGKAVPTGLGRRLGYLNSILEQTFNLNRLGMVRANLLKNAILIPHRDLVEFKGHTEQLARLHLPVSTDLDSLHSENEYVFHMRKGEIWMLNVQSVHAACNLSDRPRINLILDFYPDGQPIQSLFKDPGLCRPLAEPLMVEREPPDENFLKAVASLKHLINEKNYRDIALLLSKVHFYKDIGADLYFDWLIDIGRAAKNDAITEKFVGLKTFMIEERGLSERFYL